MEVLRNLWQSEEWEHFQNTIGNRAFWRSVGSAKALVIERKPHFLKFWKKPFWEIPRGPIGDSKDFSELLLLILEEAKTKGIGFVRVFPPEYSCFWKDIQIPIQWKQLPSPEIFPEHTLTLDLSLSEEELLAQMKPKGRYNIRLAEKKGVIAIEETSVDHFWKILKETASRDGFRTHRKSVYQKMLESFGEKAVLFSAKEETGDILSSALFVLSGTEAVYYYGASKSEKRQYMAPYLLQWKGICWAKESGATRYDFLGISPEDDSPHRLRSVSEFKEKFGGIRLQYESGKDFFPA